MTDKQIIYECNVKDCEQCSSDSVCCYCKNIACYELEKQLKAKEQECEELKSVRDSWISKCEQETKIKELYQDGLDRLKAEFEVEKNWHKTADEISKANSEYTRKLKQAIEKIKEIFKNSYCDDTENCKWCANEGNCINKQLLQICDEAINE